MDSRKSAFLTPFIVMAMVGLSCSLLQAYDEATYHGSFDSPGDWFDESKWSTGALPTSNTVARIIGIVEILL